MVKDVDFIIRYEHKVRELESIMLIKIELEKRGYSVALVCNYELEDKIEYKPRVLVVPALYNTDQLKVDWERYGVIKKIANLQWEQLIGVKEEDDVNGFHNVKGIGQRAVNFCWGEKSHNRIIKGGVKPDRAPIVGYINTDLLRGGFKQQLYSKECLAKKYNIDSCKKWLFFISSFAYCEMEEFQVELCKKTRGEKGFFEFTDISYKSRDVILDWFEIVLKSNSNIIIIYRPHPDESEKCVRLKQMSLKYPNFKVIFSEALKHWINASDKIYNWYSTGIVDAIVQNKSYRMLRPVYIPEYLDYRLMNKANSLESEKDFFDDLEDQTVKEVLPLSVFSSYYYIPEDFIYIHICNQLEEMLKNDFFDVKYSFKEKLFAYKCFYSKRVLAPIKKCLKSLPSSMLPNSLKQRIERGDRYRDVISKGYNKNVATEKEITDLYNRLKPIVYGEQV